MAYPKNRKTKTLEERFFSHVSKPQSANGCWIWTGATYSTGYGTMQKGRRGGGLIGAHRVSYLIHKGRIPDGYFVMHQCNNKICVNPEHLKVGTCAQNNLDAIIDGLRKPAEHCYRFAEIAGVKKLSAKDHDSIIEMRSNGTPVKVIASHFGVHFGTIYAICRNGVHYWSKRTKDLTLDRSLAFSYVPSPSREPA